MTKSNRSEIHIDESTQKPAPTFLQRLKNAFMAIIMGIVFAQVLLFAFRFGSILFLWSSIPFILYLTICGVLGWIVGDRFIESLRKESGNWWNLWNFWRW